MKNCLECSEKIVGREDKKFCSDACRNSFNNKINKDSTNFMRNVNNKLRKNNRILIDLNPDGKGKTTRNKMLSKGFDFEFMTNILVTKTGNTYYFVYEQGYLFLENDYVMLVKKVFWPKKFTVFTIRTTKTTISKAKSQQKFANPQIHFAQFFGRSVFLVLPNPDAVQWAIPKKTPGYHERTAPCSIPNAGVVLVRVI